MLGNSICRDVYVLDDDATVREIISRVLTSSGYTVTNFADGPSLIREFGQRTPLCILLDLCLPAVPGMEILKTLRSSDAQIPIVVISGTGNIAAAVEALKSGANDYIEKPFYGKDLILRIEKAIGAQHRVSSQSELSIHLPGREPLTKREKEILQHCVTGASSKVVAKQLGLSPRTVEDHRARVMRKLGVRNVAELVRKVTLAERAR